MRAPSPSRSNSWHNRLGPCLLLRRLGLVLVLALPLAAVAQPNTQSVVRSFEGSVTYAITYDGADRDEVELNEPPKQLVMFIRVPDFILHTRGGRFSKSLLYINDSNRVYSIDAANNRAFRSEPYRVRRRPPTATPTGDSARILGRMCYAFRYSTPETKREPARTTTLWISPSLRVDASLFRENSRAQAYFLVRGLEGCIPLRIQVQEPRLTTTTEATAVSPRSLPAVEFTLPKGMSIFKGTDYRR